jgi:hypothetical protein
MWQRTQVQTMCSRWWRMRSSQASRQVWVVAHVFMVVGAVDDPATSAPQTAVLLQMSSRLVMQVSTAAEDFMAVYRTLKDGKLSVKEGSLQYVPLSAPQLDDEAVEANEKLLDLLFAVDDVDEVYTDLHA